jgi:hypothetical protein
MTSKVPEPATLKDALSDRKTSSIFDTLRGLRIVSNARAELLPDLLGVAGSDSVTVQIITVTQQSKIIEPLSSLQQSLSLLWRPQLRTWYRSSFGSRL